MPNVSPTLLAQTVNELPTIVNNLLLLLSDKEKVVINKRFSLNGFSKHTLEEIGKEFSVTRERIRQIEKNALAKMQRNVFNSALNNLHDYCFSVVRKHGGFVKEDNLFQEVNVVLPQNLKIDKNNFHLSLVLHNNLECIGNTINFHPYVKEQDLPDNSLKFAAKHLINQLTKYGDVKKLDRIHDDLKNILNEVDFDAIKIKSLIDIDKRLTIVDNQLIGLLCWRHIHPRTLRDKILYILRKEKKPMHFTEISKKIAESKFDNRPTNVQAVHNELIRHDLFVLIGRGIYALAEWGYERGTVAAVIERILKGKKQMSQDQIIEQVLKQRQVKKITIILSLKNNKKFERIGRKVYKLKA